MNELTSSDLLAQNRAWSERTRREDPEFFQRLSQQQSPRFLWIGCSDSRVPANQITGLVPGQVFVHRNVSNIAHPTDVNLMSVLEYAVDILQVREILVVGHYGCGGIRQAISGRLPGIADFWLEPVRELRRDHHEELSTLAPQALEDRLCELNVEQQVRTLSHSGIVHRAWERGQKLKVHGWIYSLSDGVLKDLAVSQCSPGRN
ncbi:MAG: carbonic anhydrase [Fibrobacterota bacterium]|nr:carbonic anhydrase [Fibrobacterota bacterium]QQS07138.1 MAG: carbonic anhydrase [Fibrobacterota bacterium]